MVYYWFNAFPLRIANEFIAGVEEGMLYFFYFATIVHFSLSHLSPFFFPVFVFFSSFSFTLRDEKQQEQEQKKQLDSTCFQITT